MVTLTWARINEIADVIGRLSKDGKADPKASYRAARIFATGKQQVKLMQEKQAEVFAKYQSKTEDGKPEFDAQGQMVWNSPTAAEECYKEIQEMMEKTSVDVKIHRFEYQQIKHLPGADIVAIEDLVDGLPEEV